MCIRDRAVIAISDKIKDTSRQAVKQLKEDVYKRQAEAGFVPWADAGIKILLRCPCPILSREARMIRRPVYSPAAPELGCKVTPANPVITFILCRIPTRKDVSLRQRGRAGL